VPWPLAASLRRGSAIARFVGVNIVAHSEFDPVCKMWVFEETFEGRKLTEIINTDHENRKYLPGFKLPESIVAGTWLCLAQPRVVGSPGVSGSRTAVPDLEEVTRDATILVFVLPHQVFLSSLFRAAARDSRRVSVLQFLPRLLPTMKRVLLPGAKAISLIKVSSMRIVYAHWL
jgi:glycerol-3-phosphate dehydrogenase